MDTFRIADRSVNVDIVYKPIRHCYVRAKAPGYLLVTSSRRFHKADILALIESHAKRLFAQLDSLNKAALPEGQTLFGQSIEPRSEAAYFDLLKRETLAQCEMLYQKWLPRIDTLLIHGKPLFKAQAMKSRFGSCHVSKSTIKLNSKLAMVDPKYLETVFLHEIVHLKAPDHGAAFYRILLDLSPEYRRIHRELKRLFAGRME